MATLPRSQSMGRLSQMQSIPIAQVATQNVPQPFPLRRTPPRFKCRNCFLSTRKSGWCRCLAACLIDPSGQPRFDRGIGRVAPRTARHNQTPVYRASNRCWLTITFLSDRSSCRFTFLGNTYAWLGWSLSPYSSYWTSSPKPTSQPLSGDVPFVVEG